MVTERENGFGREAVLGARENSRIARDKRELKSYS